MRIRRNDAHLSRYERLLARICIGDSGCWNWTAGKDKDGYGWLWEGRIGLKSHRISYEHHHGPIPTGLVIDHLCRNTSCCNPKHLEAVTSRENTKRGSALITQCPKGHEYTTANTYVHRGRRSCITCRREANRKWSRQCVSA